MAVARVWPALARCVLLHGPSNHSSAAAHSNAIHLARDQSQQAIDELSNFFRISQ
jgi:hypothetical protein